MKITINKTTDYSKFRLLNGNRPIKQSNLKNIISSYEDGVDLFAYNPILVDKNHVIYDGQHRYKACVKLGIPIYYIYIKSMDIPSLIKLNNAQMKWNIEAFIFSWIEQGVEDYKVLYDFAKKHSLGYSVSAEILQQKQPTWNKEFNGGKFTVTSLAKGNKIAEWHKRLVDLDGTLKIRIIVRTLIELSKIEKFDFERLYKKLSTHKERIPLMGNVTEQMRYFESIYNHNIKKQSNYLRFF